MMVRSLNQIALCLAFEPICQTPLEMGDITWDNNTIGIGCDANEPAAMRFVDNDMRGTAQHDFDAGCEGNRLGLLCQTRGNPSARLVDEGKCFLAAGAWRDRDSDRFAFSIELDDQSAGAIVALEFDFDLTAVDGDQFRRQQLLAPLRPPSPQQRDHRSSIVGADEVDETRNDITAETSAIEDAVMADAKLQMMALLLGRDVDSKIMRGLGLADA